MVASCLPRRHGNHSCCHGLPDPHRLLPAVRQGQHTAAASFSRWRGSDLRRSPLAGARVGPTAGAQSAADLGFSRLGTRALSPRGSADLGSLAPSLAMDCSRAFIQSHSRSARSPARPPERHRAAEPERCPSHRACRGPGPSRSQSRRQCRKTSRSGCGLTARTPAC